MIFDPFLLLLLLFFSSPAPFTMEETFMWAINETHALGKPLLWDFSALDTALAPWASLVGLDGPTFNILVCMFGTYPLSFVFRALPSPAAKHIFSLATGLFVVQFCLRQYWIHSLLSSSLCYFLMLTLPVSVSCVLVTLTAVFWVSVVHILKILNPTESLEFEGVQMVLTVKLTSIAFNLFDGQQLFSPKGLPAALPERIREERKSRAVLKIPSPLEYFSYVYFFGGNLTGPAFDYVEYSTSVDLSKYGDKGSLIPSPVVPALKKLAYSTLFMAVYIIFSKDFTPESLTDPALLESGKSTLSILFYTWCTVFVHKSKFYFIWLLTEGGCILCSFGFEGYAENGTALWGGLNNIDVEGVELGQSIKDTTTNWNKNVSLWLRRYIYERVPPPFHLFATYLVSAFWHGFYPGYYGFFLSAAIGQESARMMRQKGRYLFMEADGKTPKRTKVVYDLCCFLLTQTLVAYTAAAFFILRLDLTLKFWASMYYFGHILIVLPWFILPFLPNGPRRDRKKVE